jgi:protein ImuA
VSAPPALHQPSPAKRIECSATLAEVFSSTESGAATGFVLAGLDGHSRVLWVQDRLSRHAGGRPYVPGIMSLLGGSFHLLHLEVPRPSDVLWAMEQALGCVALTAVVGEIWGDPPALDFTATKRLALRAERGGVQAWLLRRAAAPDLSAARERWQVRSLPSLPVSDDLHSPGEPLWSATLFRSRTAPPGERVVRRDPANGGLAVLSLDGTYPTALPLTASYVTKVG